MTEEQEKEVTRCSFTGRLLSDPASMVHISGCPDLGNMDISVMSFTVTHHNLTFLPQSKLRYNMYRVGQDGTVTVDKDETFSDVTQAKHDNVTEKVEEAGSDYSDDDDFDYKAAPASVLMNGYTYSYAYTESKNGKNCCRPTKQKCKKNADLEDVCTTFKGKILCGKKCKGVVKALEKLQQREEKKKKKNEEKKKREEKKKMLEMQKSKKFITPTSNESFKQYSSEISEEYKSAESFDEYSDEYSEEEGSKEDESGKGLKVKEGRKLNHKELKLIETASSLRAKSKNPKCKALFRSEQKDKTTNSFLNILQLQEFSSCHKVQ